MSSWGNIDTIPSSTVPFSMDTVISLQSLSDEDLLAQAEKSPSAFEVLLFRYQQPFFYKALSVMKSPDEAEDVVQETFIRIYRFAPKFRRDGGSFKAWATTILMNVARTKYSRRTVERGRVTPLLPEQYESLGSSRGQDYAEASDVVERALAGVPEDVARIMRLSFLEGLPYDEIAEKEGITVGAVKTRVHRAKKVLRKVIGDIV